MARVHKGKAVSKPQAKAKTLGSQPKNGITKTQVLALGGTEEDFDLVTNVDEASMAGPSYTDPALSQDVSKFLKNMQISNDSLKQKNRPQKHKPTGQPQPLSSTAKPPADTTPQIKLPTKVTLNPKSQFLLQPSSQWYLTVPPLDASPASTPVITPDRLAALTSQAAELHAIDIKTFQSSSSSNTSSSEANFLAKIIQSGTLSDRLSALTLLVQSSPLHNIKALETLKGMAERGKGKGGREESLKALRCIVDWWVGGGAPSRKLKYFREQPLLHPSTTNQHLLVWFFEDWLKKYFFSVLQILEALSLDSLQYVRIQSLTLIFTLLRDKPEQEQNLLRLLVNKLGDTEKSLCSRASYHLLQLVQSHPAMKAVIVREIVALVLRPSAPIAAPSSIPIATGKHIRFSDADSKQTKSKPAASVDKKTGNTHARYYATITFNQIVLTPGDRDVALKLIDVYFEMFKELLGESFEEVEDGDGGEDKEIKTDKKGRVRDDSGKSKGKGKGKITEVKGAAGFAEVEDAHSRLVSAILTGVNRALPFAKIDAGDVKINKHIDTLFLITHTSTFNISLQALVLIQQIASALPTSPSSSSSVSSTSKSIIDRYYRTLYSSLHDTRLASSSKQAMYLNLLFKSIKADAGNVDNERVKALIRRFLQVLVSGGGGATEFIAGGLFLLGELFSTIPGLRKMINKIPKGDSEAYDPRKRDPQYAHASSSPLWELTPLLHHYHPAVSLHARQLLTSQPLTASPDLSQNTLSHFLDRFVYKNPKKLKETEGGPANGKGASAMQPAASGVNASVGVKLMKGEAGDATMVNEPEFLRRKAGDVPVDQLFFHKYFSRKDEREKARMAKVGKRKNHDEESDDEDEDRVSDKDVEFTGIGGIADNVNEEHDDEEENSDEEEREIWKAMKASMPKAVGDDDYLMDASTDEDEDELASDFEAEFSGEASLDDDGDDDDNDEQKDEDDDDDVLSLVEGSDNEDLISLSGDMPTGLIEYDGSDAEEDDLDDEWGGIEAATDNKKRKREDTKGEKRKKLKSLPTFASYEDYAKMIEDGPEDDI